MSIGESYPVTARNKVRRMPDRASYDAAKIHEILDSSMLCHIAYVVDGQSYCTPTLFWRRGNEVIWHGSGSSRMIRAQLSGDPVCLTVTFLDGIVLMRTSFRHALKYRSAMVFGRPSLIEDPEEKEREIEKLVTTFLPGRTLTTIPPTPSEIKQAHFLRMPIEEATAKICEIGSEDEGEEFRDGAAWAGVIPIETRVGEPVPCSTLRDGIPPGPELEHYRDGARLDQVLLKIRKEAYAAGK